MPSGPLTAAELTADLHGLGVVAGDLLMAHASLRAVGEDYFVSILKDYLAAGRAAVGTVGRATSELIDAADITDFAVTWMARHLAH